jgi:uncharacterized LabA/DUF88 family protein
MPDAPHRPKAARAIAFIDGQNLYHCAREAFGCTHPDYDVLKLARRVCQDHGWLLSQVRFYTGYPSRQDNPLWSGFWQRKLLAISRQGVWKFSRQLRYRNKTFRLDDGSAITRRVAEEKGIDVRIAIDIIRLALAQRYDVAVIFSQDQDLSEAVDEIRSIARHQGRHVTVACPFPVGPGTTNTRGINGTDWIRLDAALWQQCIDPTDYRQ